MKKTVIASAVSAGTAGEMIAIHCREQYESSLYLNQQYHGKRGKKGKQNKDWHKR